MLTKPMPKLLTIALTAVCVIQFSGCGTLLHPERKGQKGGSIDVGIALLDGLGLLFFLIPGIIAFAVDFSNGTIYLPATNTAAMKQIKFDPKTTNIAGVEAMIKKETGRDVKLTQDDMKVSELKSTDDMMVQFAKYAPDTEHSNLAMAK